MDRFRRCRFSTWSYDADGVGLVPEEVAAEGFVLALAIARGGDGQIERALRRRRRGMLSEVPDAEVEVVLARPKTLWKDWARGQALRGAAGRRKRYEILREQALELPVGLAAIHDDQLDAAASAYAAYLWATKQAESRGAEVIPAAGRG